MSIDQKDQHRSSWLFLCGCWQRFLAWPEKIDKRNLVLWQHVSFRQFESGKKPLPLPGDWHHMRLDITNIIDSLHIANHKDRRCREIYSPQQLKKDHPHMNTMCCEQTFAWLSRYKRISSSMPKMHHHFYLHHMVKRRNEYIERCYMQGRRPGVPNVKAAHPQWLIVYLSCFDSFICYH